jgi:hypothetical protein
MTLVDPSQAALFGAAIEVSAELKDRYDTDALAAARTRLALAREGGDDESVSLWSQTCSLLECDQTMSISTR